MSAFAVAGLTLALIGIYGVVGYTVTQRTREAVMNPAINASIVDIVGDLLQPGVVLGDGGPRLRHGGGAI